MTACALATSALAIAVGTTTAGRISLNSRTFRATWSHLEFVSESVFGSDTVRCPVTIEGSFHSATIQKNRGALIGYVTRATALSAACTSGTMTVLQNALPWHYTYEGFSGRLPIISAIFFLLTGAAVAVTARSITCLARSEVNNNISGRASLGGSNEITSIETAANAIPLTGAFPCPGAMGSLLPSTSTVTQLNSSSRITVRLI